MLPGPVVRRWQLAHLAGSPGVSGPAPSLVGVLPVAKTLLLIRLAVAQSLLLGLVAFAEPALLGSLVGIDGVRAHERLPRLPSAASFFAFLSARFCLRSRAAAFLTFLPPLFLLAIAASLSATGVTTGTYTQITRRYTRTKDKLRVEISLTNSPQLLAGQQAAA